MTTTRLSRSDLKFYPSERLADYPDSGGLALGTPIKGEANEIFNPISDLARVNGDLSLRLVYAGVQKDSDEPLIGANIAITKPPSDNSVSYLLTHAQFGELRKSGVSKVEGYVTQSFESNLTLLSSPSKGSKMIQAYTRVGEKLPSVGDRFCLDQNKQGYPVVSQYIQVVKVESTERTFTDAQGVEFSRLVAKIEISQPLAYDFIGAEQPSRYYIDVPCKIRETTVADSARYFGVKPLVEAVKAGAMSVKVPDIMAKIVPTAMVETALTDRAPTPSIPSFVKLNGQLTWHGVGHPERLHLPPFLAGSLTANTSGGDWSDKNGKLMQGEDEVGVVEYTTGVVLINPSVRHYIYSLAITPAAVAEQNGGNTHAIGVGIANRGYTYAVNLPQIGAGSLIVRYLSNGKWYELKDNGRGQLVGASTEHGSGTISYQTGTVAITCGEMPDVGSSILFSWGGGASFQSITPTALTGKVKFKLKDTPRPETISIRLGPHTGQVNDKGRLTGQLTGNYDADDNELWVETDDIFSWGYNVSEDKTVVISYSVGEVSYKDLTAPPKNEHGQIIVKLSETPIVAGAVRLFVKTIMSDDDKKAIENKGASIKIPDGAMTLVIVDNGAGKLFVNDVEVGTINYDTATATFGAEHTVTILEASILKESYQVTTTTKRGGLSRLLGKKRTTVSTHTRVFDNGYEPKEVRVLITGASNIHARFYEQTATTSASETLPINEIIIQIPKKPYETLVNRSLHLNFGGIEDLYDTLGVLYKSYNAHTGQGVAVGSVDYRTGLVVLRQFIGFQAGHLHTALVSQNTNTINELHFATPIRPIRPSSLQIIATTKDGISIRATANQDGDLEADGIDGVVDVATGIAHIRFGRWVIAEGNEGKAWYDEKAVVDGQIWEPIPVLADSVKYNAVATSELPIDSSIIKIDTVRLPSDGRVPIFRLGDTILIGNRATTDIGSAFTGGQTIQLPRQNLDRICIKDSNGKPLDASLYDDDLENGVVTFKSPLDLSGYKLPLVAMHAIEEKNRLANTDIDGTLTLMFPLRNSYEVGDTYVSSVLAHGDLQVRSSIPFTQKNWNGKWADEPVGDPLLNRLNVKDYPIILTDDGAINERWLIKFTSSTQFELYGETLGFVMRTDILQNLAPINPSTGKPYFALDKRAFGGSDSAGSQGQAAWASQDVIRFNTDGTLLPVWIIRSVNPSTNEQVGDDGFSLCVFGDTTEI